MPSDFDSVGRFHTKFGLPTATPGSPPRIVDDSTFLFRYQFLQEELQELLSSHRAGDVAGVADALVDLVYVALGTAHMYGIPFDDVFAEVQRANMSKERASGACDYRSKRGSNLDVVKPEGWIPPDVAGAIDRWSSHSGPSESRADGRMTIEEYRATCGHKVGPGYVGMCSSCGLSPIHKTNSSGICFECATSGGGSTGCRS
jgi:predicted HAD superfamily Cof-like phosphohydrolase